ncbi:MAG: (Fe-S)-binding protein [Gemmatimonadetes bacterium]|nr:(Fe-S)-binding protein [Gemmatimonadota bacterium]NIR79168.1 (Fe-S)-binding protein [Gemmatimonadota bacterium]NIT87823.1 (Fe-S)-binding protein [Gemmatimonadota bacterium]NIU31684.1 (Fe-S)-binding protein [Gemmatimonadota bacterium]NIU36303.1 (Fe-S)-binding protein [Gemmatimonadota bacterium]
MRIALFVTCLVDLFRPAVGRAASRLLRSAGCEVEVPRGQTCCGQPAFNAGDRKNARKIAASTARLLDGYEHVVVPSASCAAMLRHQYPELLDGTEAREAAERVSRRTHELTSFLAEVASDFRAEAARPETVCYHDSCQALREMEVRDQPRRLLAAVEGLELVEPAHPEECCGFGGTFCVKYPDVSNHMVSRKAEDVLRTGATTLCSTDMGCLLNIAGKLAREGASVGVRHVAELLAGDEGAAPIAGSRTRAASDLRPPGGGE